MKSQGRILLDKMSGCQLNIKIKNHRPSLSQWYQDIIGAQQQINYKKQQSKDAKESIHMKKSRSQQPSLLFVNKRFQHLRYHSQNNEGQIESQSEEELTPKGQEELETTQKNSNTNEKEPKADKVQIVQIQNDFKESAYFRAQSSLDQLKFNEEFLDLFKKQKEACHFGYLSKEKVKEQEILIKKILDSRPSKPIPDIKTFLSLIKKPQVEIEHSKPKQQQEFVLHLIFAIFLLIFVSIFIVM